MQPPDLQNIYEQKPDWNFWKNRLEVKLWEAAFLADNVDPTSQEYRLIPRLNLLNKNVSNCLVLLKDHLSNGQFFTPPTRIHINPNHQTVNLRQFARWCLYIMKFNIPEELAELAKKPDTTTVVHSGKQDENLSFEIKQGDEEIHSSEMDILANSEKTNLQIDILKSESKRTIKAYFENIYFVENQWNDALGDVPKWLELCRVEPAYGNTSAMWNPVCIALALIKEKGITLRRLDEVFKDWDKWQDEWKKKTSHLCR